MSDSLFSKYDTVWLLNGDRLRELRKHAGLTQVEFARLAGWSRSYQQKLEGTAGMTLSAADAEVIRTIVSTHVYRDLE